MAETLRVRAGITALICLALAAAGGLAWLAATPHWQPTPPTPPAAADARRPAPDVRRGAGPMPPAIP